MERCQSCGGELGRDCWNPQECAEITAQMAQQQSCTERQALDELHEGLRQRGMRLPSADPVADALAALDEWKGYADDANALLARMWRPMSEQPSDEDQRPTRQFIFVRGAKSHNGAAWPRGHWGLATIQPVNPTRDRHAFRREDIVRICVEGDIDVETAIVTHWMPAVFPAPANG